MNINFAMATEKNKDGTFKAVIFIGDFASEDAALRLAISGGQHIADVLHASKKVVEEGEQHGK